MQSQSEKSRRDGLTRFMRSHVGVSLFITCVVVTALCILQASESISFLFSVIGFENRAGQLPLDQTLTTTGSLCGRSSSIASKFLINCFMISSIFDEN